MGNNKIFGYKKQNDCQSNYHPQNTHLVWEDDLYGLYFVRADNNKILEKSTDKMATTETVETRTNANISRGFHDKDNHIIYLVDCDYDDGTSYIWSIDLSDDSVTEINNYSGDIFDIWRYDSDTYILVFINQYDIISSGITTGRGIDWDGTYYYIADIFDNGVYRFSPGFLSSTFYSLGAGYSESAVCWDGSSFFIPNYSNGEIDEFDTDFSHVANYDIGALGGNDAPWNIEWDGTNFFVLDWDDGGTVYKYPSDFSALTTSYNIGALGGNDRALGICWDGTYFYITDDDGYVYKYPSDFSALTASYDLTEYYDIDTPTGICWDGTKFIVTDAVTDKVYNFSTDFLPYYDLTIINVIDSESFVNSMGSGIGNNWNVSQITIVNDDEFFFIFRWGDENCEIWRFRTVEEDFTEMEDCGSGTELPSIQQGAIAYDNDDTLYFVLGSGTQEISTIDCDSTGASGGLAGLTDEDWITIYTIWRDPSTGEYSQKKCYIWFDATGGGGWSADPGDGYEDIWVDYSGCASDQDLSDAITEAVNNTTLFNASNGGGTSKTVTITNQHSGNVTNIADHNSELICAVDTGGADPTHYLYTYSITGDVLTQKGVYDIALMLDRNTWTAVEDSSGNYRQECFRLEKGFGLTVEDNALEVYQISRARGELHFIAQANRTIKIPYPNSYIGAITDSYLFLYHENGTKWESWEYLDLVAEKRIHDIDIIHPEREYPDCTLLWRKTQTNDTNKYFDPPAQDQLLQVYGTYTSTNGVADIVSDESLYLLYRGAHNFSGITTTANYYKGSGGINYEDLPDDYFEGSGDLNSETVGTSGTNINWVDAVTLYNGACEIVESWQDHNNVLRLQDDADAGEDPSIVHNITQATSGVFECWIGTNDVTEEWLLNLYEDGVGFIVLLTITGSKLYYTDHLDATQEIQAVANNILYHIKIQWYIDDTFDVTVDGTLQVDGVQTNNEQTSGVDSVRIKAKGDSTDYLYIDAPGLVGENSYIEGRNRYDGVSGTDIDWVDAIGGTDSSMVKIIVASEDGHNNVLKHTSGGDNGTYSDIYHTITETDNTVEIWGKYIDNGVGRHTFNIKRQDYQVCINTFFNASDNLFYYQYGDGMGGSLNGSVAAAADTWHHIKIIFRCSDDTYDIYLNGVELDTALPFYNDRVATSMLQITLQHTNGAGANALESYWDAPALVGETDPQGYTYEESWNINPYDIDELLDLLSGQTYNITCAFNGSYIKVDDIDEHKDVICMYDNQGDIDYGDLLRFYLEWTDQTYGTIEAWIRSSDVTYSNTIIVYGDGTLAFQFRIDADKFQYYDGGWNDVGLAASDDTWYYIRIAFECTSGSYESLAQYDWKVWINGVEYGDYDMANNRSDLDTILFYTNQADNGYTFYIDAVDFSWSTNYVRQRNRVLSLDDQIIFEGLTDSHDRNILTDISGISKSTELDTISPKISDYSNYTGKTSGAIITQLISDFCNYITAGTISTGSTTWTCPADWSVNGNKSLRSIINEFADTEYFTWSIRPTGELDFDDGSVSSYVTITNDDNYENPHVNVLSEKYNQVIIYGGYVDSAKMGPYTYNNQASQQLHGIITWTKTYAGLYDATILQTLADNKGLLQGASPLIWEADRDMIDNKNDFGFIQPHETVYLSEGVLVGDDSDETISSTEAGEYILSVNQYDGLNDDSRLKITEGLLFKEDIQTTLSQQNSELITQIAVETQMVAYPDASISSGDHNAEGVKSTFTAGENVVFGDFCYFKSDGKMWKSDADAVATMPIVAMTIETITADNTGLFLLTGIARDDTWNWGTIGGLLYGSITTGEVSQSAPVGSGDQVQLVGWAITADIIYFKPDFELTAIP